MGVIIKLQKQLIMKVLKPFVLLSLLFSFVLTGCDDEGFSISASSEYYQQENDKEDTTISENKGDNVTGGGGGANSEEHPEETTEQPQEGVTPGTPADPVEPVDLGNQIVTFTLHFVEINEDDFAIVTYSDDPFDAKYNFDHYTIDNVELDNSKEVFKETINEKETYKLYLGSKESKTYTIQFYNKDGKQYGRSELIVNIPVVHHSFFNNIINIIEIKIVSIGVNAMTQINKIGEFFKKLFGKKILA